MKTAKLLIALALSLLSLSSALAAPSEAPIVLRFSHVVTSDGPKGLAADFFAKRAGELTRGRVKVEVYPNSTLYKDNEEMEALQVGAVQMLAPTLSKFGPIGIKAFEVFDLPYLFDNINELHKITQGPVGQMLLDKLSAKGIKGLTYWDQGPRHFSANTPIQMPADLRGKKMRIQPSKVLEAQMRALGAIPRVIPFSDVYQALRDGTVDGTDNPLSNLYTQKMYDVQKYLTLTEHSYMAYAVIVNQKFWDDLPGDVRGQLETALKETTQYANEAARKAGGQALESIRRTSKMEIRTPTKTEREAFKKAMLPVHREMEGHVGKDVIEAVYREIGARQENN
jgi:C4-dicarboxylate-binding protein DctP